MQPFDIIAVLISLAAIFGYLNYRYIKLPTTIGLMLLGLLFSFVIIIAGQFKPGLAEYAKSFVENVELDETLLGIMLSYLLFAGALHVKLQDLSKEKWIIAILATFGVVISTFVVGSTSYFILKILNMEISYLYCLLFGALISSTDPVAVLGILKKAGAPNH